MKCIFAGLLLISVVFAQDTFVGDTFDRGSIDYNGRKVKATGIGPDGLNFKVTGMSGNRITAEIVQ